MKHLLYLLVFLLASFLNIDAQNILPKAYEITTDTIKGRVNFPDSCWQILQDSNSKWTIGQVSSSPIANRFLKPSPENIKGEFAIHTFWFRYRLENNMDRDVIICIPGGSDKDETFFQDSSGKWHHQLSGAFQPGSKMDGFKIIPAMPVTIPAGRDVLIYERVTSNNRLGGPSTAFTDFIFEKNFVDENDGFISKFYFNAVFFTLILGVLLFAALLNFVFFLMVREKVYLYFALFVLSIGLLRYANGGFLSRFLFKEHPWIGYLMDYISVPVLFFSLIQFTRSYLNTPMHFPRWDKFLAGLGIFTPVISVVHILIKPALSYDAFLMLSQVVTLNYSLNTLIILITFFFYIRRPERMVRLVIIAGLPMLLFWLTFLGNTLYWVLLSKVFGLTVPSFFQWSDKWSGQIEQSCVAWFAVVFSWILLLRFIQLRKE